VDNNILKLDTVSAEYIRRVDQPQGAYDVQQVIDDLKAFHGHVIVQSMFMQGMMKWKDENGVWKEESVDNTSDEYVLPWLEALKEIRPRQVMIYTIDRETPTPGLEKATHEQLDRIAALVRAAGIDSSVSY
jgi:hypothetical protein